MSTRLDFINALESLVSGTLPLDKPEQVLAISQAVKAHSKNKPRIIPEEESGTGGFDYALTLLASWVEGFSVIKSVEYPVDDTKPDPDILQDDQWTIYHKPSGKVLRFLEDKPLATEKLRVTYTTLHACTDALSTIDAFDEEAVQVLSASFFCLMLAAYYAQDQDSTIAADSVDHRSKATEYAARARAYRKLYFDHLGIKEGETTAASVTRDQDMAGSWAADKITHPKRRR